MIDAVKPLVLKSLKNNFTPCKSLVLGFCLLSIFLNFISRSAVKTAFLPIKRSKILIYF
ncbi:hypothetical protein CSUNSWCD_1537 [Campylobacter showae CSUNSWCD]|uniref:Uncharacterized protein n=1 Tax=Campylobacter showae CSUNSWCD TaxID=1244083 RepID=M5IH12_9BACT|nr:hypothetical protein CSUNSWCD_1537 [Campylobacter showae CSUNSWCD]